MNADLDLSRLFAESSEVQTVPAGTVIFREGDPGDTMYVVIEGEVELTMHGKPLTIVDPGGVFGEMSLIDHHQRSADAVVKTDARLMEINERRFLFLVSETPFFALKLLRVMVARVRQLDTLL